MKLGIISLGCEKNKVDSELFLGLAKKYQLEITNSLDDVDILVVNTCGFIASAKKESIDTILSVIDLRKNNVKIVVIGCLVERYYQELKDSIPDVDFYFPIRDYDHLDSLFKELTNSNESYKLNYQDRVLTTSNYSVYIRIADGCNNKCAYCAIPLIRGPFKSRPFDEIIEEAKHLIMLGAKEITLIAQDTTRYGTDFTDDPRRLHDLIHEITKLDCNLVRVLYLYPDEITDELLKEIATNEKVAKYFDIPIQHANDRLLKLMNRRGSKELIKERINYLRSLIPEVIVRTTLIVGFPTETKKEFNELYEFVKEIKFERMGAFMFSNEEDTASFDIYPKVPHSISKKRYNKLMKLQQTISKEFNNSLIGNIYPNTLIEGYDENELAYIGRNYMFAPDDVDGKIYIYSPVPLNIGDMVTIKIINAENYDLYAELKK